MEFILSRSVEELKRLTGVEIAGSIGINSKPLERMFKIEQRISLQAFILREKIHRAFSILTVENKKPIVEIAKEFGFRSVEEFSAEFEKQFAIAPRKYRDLKKPQGFSNKRTP